MQHNSNIPETSMDALEHSLATLQEHFDDVVVACHHHDTKNIKVISPNPYAGLGMLPTIQQKLRGFIEQAEMDQMMREESFRMPLDDDESFG